MMVHRSAIISDCKKYRYGLSRVWADGPGRVLWVGCNPSWADAEIDDRTVGRMIGFSRHWGYPGLWVVNAYAYTTPYPDDLRRAADPVGPMCDQYIRQALAFRPLIVACWGANVPDTRRKELEGMLGGWGPIWCLGQNVDGSPKHPLYLPAETKPVAYVGI